MKGDFSFWRYDPLDNDQGLLYQQGRVMRDADMTASELIDLHWRNRAGRDIIGARVAAVPAGEPDGFKVESAKVSGSDVHVKIKPGRVWADGLLLYLPPDPANPTATRERVATYLESPPNPSTATVANIGANVRDAVVLEVALEELSGFQEPDRLIEPALGGPDTAERISARYGFRLLRLGASEDCNTILSKLADGPTGKGKLTVSLTPPPPIVGECPVVAGGGYTGFEHNLYRIEVAHVNSGAPRFKWSQFNGGLVGRGTFHAGTPKRVVLIANRAAIVNSGLTQFYLEALQKDDNLGHWRVVYGAMANLNNAFDLELTDPPVFGTFPSTTDTVFFRLWNGLENVSAFTNSVTPQPLRDGIHLVFDLPAAGSTYRPGDYWVFSVRAGEISNPQTLINAQPPLGPKLQRVPLAEIDWTAAKDTTVSGTIEDCRRIFQPLTRLRGCCRYTVGDGMVSFGDFDTIQAAVNALPAAGGEICVLPGQYPENVTISGKDNVTIKGCGAKTRVITATAGQPVIAITDADNVRIESLALVCSTASPGVRVAATPLCNGVTLRNLYISAATRGAIEVMGGRYVTIEDCRIRMNDVFSFWHAVFVIADDVSIERNRVHVERSTDQSAGLGSSGAATAGRGGLQIGGTSERVRVIDNWIEAGIGNGITLGSLELVNEDGATEPSDGSGVEDFDECNPCKPGDSYVPPGSDDRQTPTYRSAGPLYDVLIERNRIYAMGLNGIGVVAFFNLDAQDEFITVVRLNIIGNDIRRCLRRTLAPIPTAMLNGMGYGGIALADVEYLVVRDNLIEDNGVSHLEPICGIFVLHGEGVEIVRNRILHNGPKTQEPAKAAKNGARGGIYLVYAVANTTPVRLLNNKNNIYPRQDGVPAVQIHDNVVVQPLGQALAVGALGPVSVVGNAFTSQAVLSTGSSSFIAGCVLIFNLGISNEFYGQLFAFSGVLNGSITAGPAGPDVTDDAVLVPRQGLDDVRIGQYLANGNVLFANNQCMLDLIETGLSLAVSSVLIFTLDDVGFYGNQCDCNLLDDFVISQAVVLGVSVRIADNRFKEGWFNALYSAITLGIMNATTNNQGTHCFLVGGPAALRVDNGNRVLRDVFDAKYNCGDATRAVIANSKNQEIFV